MNEKMRIYWADREEWQKERDEALLSMDVKTFRIFYGKWMAKGIYTKPLPRDNKIVEMSIRQAVLALENAPEEKKEEAKAWLREHGCSDNPWR